MTISNLKTTSIILFGLMMLSCSTGPDFDRINPYDRDPNSEVSNSSKFPPPTDQYFFSGTGLVIKIPFSHNDEVKVERKNGTNTFKTLGSFDLRSTSRFLDSDIILIEDFGFPLEYKFTNQNSNSNSFGSIYAVKISFGSLPELSQIETENLITISWKDSIYSNDGVEVFKKIEEQITSFQEIKSPDTSLTILNTEENLESEFLVSPYKYYQEKKTYLDTTSYLFKSSAPSNSTFEIISGNKIELNWKDNSENESGYRVVNNQTNKVYEISENQESLIMTENLEAYDQKSYSIYSVFGETLSLPSRIDTTIPDFPYPRIIDVEHINETQFRIYFEDRVSFDREIYFDNGYEGAQFIGTGSEGFVEISTNGDYDAFEINFSTGLSFGRYGSKKIPISYRFPLKTLGLVNTPKSTQPKTLDVRTIGNLLIYGAEKSVFQINLNTLQSSPVVTLSEDVNLIRMSNGNTKAFISTTNNSFYILDLVNASIIHEIEGISGSVFDASFIHDDSDILLSTSDNGMIIYHPSSESISEVSGFSTTGKLEFVGDATQTRLLVFDRNESIVHYFNTLSNFEYYNSVEIERTTINGFDSDINNISHLNSSQNSAAFKIGGVLEYEINRTGCNPNNFVCYNGSHNPYQNDRNAFVQVLDDKYRVISTDNFLRIVYKNNLNDIHIIERKTKNVSMLKINFDANVIVEFDSNSNELSFYNISKEWGFTNYGIYFDLVWPEN